MNFQLWPDEFLILFEIWGHTVPHWKALRSGKNETRGVSCSSNSSIYNDDLKRANLLHKRGPVDSQLIATVNWEVFKYFWMLKSTLFGEYILLRSKCEYLTFFRLENIIQSKNSKIPLNLANFFVFTQAHLKLYIYQGVFVAVYYRIDSFATF